MVLTNIVVCHVIAVCFWYCAMLDEQQRVIGAHVLGNPASEIITLAGTAIELGLTAAQWKKIVFPHPTVGEIFREVL